MGLLKVSFSGLNEAAFSPWFLNEYESLTTPIMLAVVVKKFEYPIMGDCLQKKMIVEAISVIALYAFL